MARPKGSKNKSTKAKPDKAPKTKAKAKSKAAAGGAASAERPESVKGTEVKGMINKTVLNDILTLDKKTKDKQSSLAGDLGSAIAKAVDRFGTNRKALGIIRTLNRMEPEKLADFLDHFDYMLDISGLEDRAAAVQRLPMGDTPAEAEDDAGDDGKVAGEAPADDVSPPSAFTGPRLVAAGE